MAEDITITRGQLRDAGADEEWFRTYMRGRGRLPLSKVITCAPDGFEVRDYDRRFTGIVRHHCGERTIFFDGKLHCEHAPAFVSRGGAYWYWQGELHRDGGPAAVFANGHREWWFKNTLHREDGPAIEYADGSFQWYLNGNRYRDEDEWKEALKNA